MKKYKEILNKHLPLNAVDIILRWILFYKIHLQITKRRTSKLGDYRAPTRHKTHRISVNYDLNKYVFLITLVHEIAHLIVWNNYKNKVKPHGAEWKTTFKKLMNNFMDKSIFPVDILEALNNYLKNPAASTSSNIELARILKKYDNNNNAISIEEIPLNSIFKMPDGRIFRKEEKIRKRYRCFCLSNKKQYLFNPMAEIILIKN